MFLFKRSNGYYYVYYRSTGGKWKSITTRTKLKPEANRFFSNLKQNLEVKKEPLTLAAYQDRYLEYSRSTHSPQTTQRTAIVLAHFCRFIGSLFVAEITPLDIEHFKTHRLGRVSPVTVNIELRTLKAFFNLAVDWEILNLSPFRKVKPARVAEQLPVYLSKDDFRKLLSQIRPAWLRALVVFAANTGMRRGELINLKWGDVDIAGRLLRVKNTDTFTTKSKRERLIPLNRQAQDTLNAQDVISEYVFTDARGNKLRAKTVSENFQRAVKDSELNPLLHFHSLRHTFATWLVRDGVSIYEVQKLLGHSTVKMTEVYSHLASSDLHNTVGKLDTRDN